MTTMLANYEYACLFDVWTEGLDKLNGPLFTLNLWLTWFGI